MTSSVISSVVSDPPRSSVTALRAIASATTSRRRWPCSGSPMKSSIIAAERKVAVGLALCCPAILGPLACQFEGFYENALRSLARDDALRNGAVTVVLHALHA